jgi:hypothetical protein
MLEDEKLNQRDVYAKMFGYTTLHEIPNPAFEKRKVFIYFNST